MYETFFFFHKKKMDGAGVLAMFPCVGSFMCNTSHGFFRNRLHELKKSRLQWDSRNCKQNCGFQRLFITSFLLLLQYLYFYSVIYRHAQIIRLDIGACWCLWAHSEAQTIRTECQPCLGADRMTNAPCGNQLSMPVVTRKNKQFTHEGCTKILKFCTVVHLWMNIQNKMRLQHWYMQRSPCLRFTWGQD
jgi:hypothetical protein